MLRRTLLLFSVKFPLKSRGAMLLGTSCNLSQSSNQTSLLELCSDLRRKEFKIMTTYLYPQNLKATANLWLWSLRDFAIMSMALLLSILILAQTRIIVPLAVTLCFGFLSIRLEDTTILDFIRYAVKYFISTQQTYFWAERSK